MTNPQQAKANETQEQVRNSKITPRFLLACALSLRMRAINVRPEYAKIVLERNGFSKGEADEATDQAKDRWDKMSPQKQRETRSRVEMKQLISDMKKGR